MVIISVSESYSALSALLHLQISLHCNTIPALSKINQILRKTWAWRCFVLLWPAWGWGRRGGGWCLTYGEVRWGEVRWWWWGQLQAGGARDSTWLLSSLQPPRWTAPAEKTVSRPSAGQDDRRGEQSSARSRPGLHLPRPSSSARPSEESQWGQHQDQHGPLRHRAPPQPGAGRGTWGDQQAGGLGSPSGRELVIISSVILKSLWLILVGSYSSSLPPCIRPSVKTIFAVRSVKFPY